MFYENASGERLRPQQVRLGSILRTTAKRTYEGAPGVVLGVLLITLDTISTGLLVFPPTQEDEAFGDLQVQGISLYIMSTIVSQLTLSLGGSGFEGAFGAMLTEVLPFLRAVASDIRQSVGDDSPRLIPTVVVAYAMTSILIGLCFLVMAALKLGWIAQYFPPPVLIGIIGAIGLEIFLLGFELAIPVNNPELKLSNAGILFTTEHVPVLLASILPSIVLIVTLRLKSLARLTKGWTENALYVPWFVLTVAAIFWIVVGAKGQANAQGMTQLSSQGWLFALQQPISGHGLGTSWNYWNLFDFRLVAWSAIPHAAKNIALVVIIGVLNLPIWVPALGMVLKEPHFDVDRELLGHGISNIISGAVGTLPNLVVLSFSRLFTFAGGGRPEGLAVAGFSLVVFFTAGRLLPYIPTIVASIMVYYVGLDLMIEAWWVSMQELAWGEWLVVLGTSAACTALGFLEGVGTGLGLALLAYFFAHMLRSRPTLTTLPLARDSKQARLRLDDTTVSLRSLHNSSEVTLLPESLPEIKEKNQDNQNEVSVVSVSGNLSFANVPLLERRLSDAVKQHNSESIVLDVTKVTSCETCVPQMLLRIFTLYNMLSSTPPFVLAGLHPGSGAAADMLRGGVQCRWPEIQSVKEEEDGAGKLPAYLDLPGALNAVRKHQFPLSQAFEHGVAEEIRAVMDGESGLNTLSQISKQASVRILRDGSGTVYKLEKGDTLPLSSKYQNLTQMSKY